MYQLKKIHTWVRQRTSTNLCSNQVPNRFPTHSYVFPNILSTTPHCPICFAQCHPLGTYIGGLILRINMPFYVWNQESYIGKSPKLLNLFFYDGTIKLEVRWKKKSLKGTPQLINMDHNNITYIINIYSLTIMCFNGQLWDKRPYNCYIVWKITLKPIWWKWKGLLSYLLCGIFLCHFLPILMILFIITCVLNSKINSIYV